ncbi:hypothetical protein ODS41_08880 [Pyrobaculum sp. 3827-6]|uniref:hypothetical protein n=1 Tax=Pyrobaculum sp. 3827-6 TaxID=2983604 RepID=UPI0021DA441B|nr:hypothetical protein [Pyrobaculum sp. 3827-6]MCU7788024.1 hypothetical protein [Pyrobaculum sp. 3827-6]
MKDSYTSRMDERFREIRRILTEILEEVSGFKYRAAREVEELLEKRGVHCDIWLDVRLPADGLVKIDLYCPQPLVVGKVAVSLIDTEEVEEALTQLRKLAEAAEKSREAKTYLAVLAVEFAPRDVAQYLRKRAEEEDIHLILGREY